MAQEVTFRMMILKNRVMFLDVILTNYYEYQRRADSVCRTL